MPGPTYSLPDFVLPCGQTDPLFALYIADVFSLLLFSEWHRVKSVDFRALLSGFKTRFGTSSVASAKEMNRYMPPSPHL